MGKRRDFERGETLGRVEMRVVDAGSWEIRWVGFDLERHLGCKIVCIKGCMYRF